MRRTVATGNYPLAIHGFSGTDTKYQRCFYAIRNVQPALSSPNVTDNAAHDVYIYMFLFVVEFGPSTYIEPGVAAMLAPSPAEFRGVAVEMCVEVCVDRQRCRVPSSYRYELFRGTIVIRTFDQYKHLDTPVFLPTVFRPDYYVPQ